jgi:hypothetical protein
MNEEFVRPVLIGRPLRAEGSIVEVVSPREALVEAFLYNEKGKECARSRASIATFQADTIKNLGFSNKALISQFEAIIKGY